MKFGKFLEEKSKAEWRLYYVDYRYLKQVIKQMKQSITSERQSKQEAEHMFTKAIEMEIKKVNDFFLMIEKEVQGKLIALRQLLNKLNTVDPSQTRKQALHTEVSHLATQMTDLYEYTLVNFTAFRKILKKHDRHTDMVASPWFLARCKQQPFYSSSKQFGNMLVKLSNCCAAARSILGEGQPTMVDQGLPSIPSSTRYWIKIEDVMHVKTQIVQHLPVHILSSSSSRFRGSETTDAVSIASCYYDNPSTFESYESRVNRQEGATAIRFRTYEDRDQVFVERKTHHEKLSGSTKERLELNSTDVFDFVRGTFKVQDFVAALEQEEHSEESIRSACALFADIQNEILHRGFVPSLRTMYDRSAFQDTHQDVVKIAIDTNIQMIKENLKLENDGRWCKSEIEISEDDVHEFPYAVMEVKLQSGQLAPEWLQDLVNGPLVRVAARYSKFTHGCAMLNLDKIHSRPPWMEEFVPKKKKKEAKEDSWEITEETEELEFRSGVWGDQIEHHAVDDRERLIGSSDPALRSRLQSESMEDVHRVLSQRTKSKPTLFTKVRNLFDFDQHFVKDGKPIMSRMKIEPKTYFANERTFLQWMSFCVIIQGIGVALISFPSSNFVGLVSGACFVLISIAFMGYSLFLFRWRAARIRNNQPGRYDDFWGPFTLFCVMTAAVVVNSLLFLSTQIFELSENEVHNNLA